MKLEEIEKKLQDLPLDPFTEVDYLLLERAPVKYDFVDRELIGKPAILLERYTDESIAALGRAVIPMLSSRFSAEGAAAIFVLSYHLKAPGSRFRAFIFNPDANLQMMTDQRYSDLHDKVNQVKTVITATGDPTREAAVYSYVAASLFRLFTKPASYYVKTWDHVLNGFFKSYKEHMRLMLPVPTEEAVQSLKFWFNQERAKVTLYRFLYMSNSDASHMDFKSFLYDNHLRNTGLHIVSIIEQLSDVLSCSMGSIITAIEPVNFNSQVSRCLLHVLKMMTENNENHKMNMWRYGRLFDNAFLSDLQTKSCVKLVYVLAEALRSEAPEKHSGILHIAQFAGMCEDTKWRCAIAAQGVLTYLKDRNTIASGSRISLLEDIYIL